MAVVARMASSAPPTRSDSGYTGAESGRREVVGVVAEKGQVTELWNHRDDFGLTQHVSANIHAGAVEGGDNECYAVLGMGQLQTVLPQLQGFAPELAGRRRSSRIRDVSWAGAAPPVHELIS
jgi:hypothetical protein